MSFSRISIDESKDQLKVTIKTQRNRWFVFKTSLLLLCCYVIQVFLIVMLLGSMVSYAWVIIAILFGVSVFWFSCCFYFTKALVWMALGKEVITINNKHITIEKKRGWGHPDQSYALHLLQNLQLGPAPVTELNLDIDIFGSPFSRAIYAIEAGGRLKFDVGLKTIRFGNLLSNDEAESLRKKVIEFVASHSKGELVQNENAIEASRVTLTETPHGLELVIPVRKSIFLIVATSAWLLVWLVSTCLMLQDKNFSFSSMEAGHWLILAVNVLVFLIIVHMIFGKESIRFDSKGLRHHRQWNIHWPKRYDWSLVKDFRAEEELVYKKMVGIHSGKTSFVNRPNWIWTIEVKDVMTFNYKGKKVRIGRGIDEAEAKLLVKQILDKYPLYKRGVEY